MHLLFLILYYALSNFCYYGESSADLSGNKPCKFPAMSVHTLTMTSYNARRGHNGARATQVVKYNKLHRDYRPSYSPRSPMTMTPRFPTILYPEVESPRPAVIGIGSNYASYTESAKAIKEILSSVLNLPSSIKTHSPTNTQLQDSDLEKCEGSNTGDKNVNSDSPDSVSDGILSTPSSQNDIRFSRHKAAWDNSQLDAAITPPSNLFAFAPPAPITNRPSVPELEMTPFVKCIKCDEVFLPEPEDVSTKDWNVNPRKEKRRFSSPSIAPGKLKLHDPSLEQFALLMDETSIDDEISTAEDKKSFKKRSWSDTNLFKASENSPNSSTDPVYSTEENLHEPSASVEKENEHFLAADLYISLVEMMKSSMQYEQWKTEPGLQWIQKDPVNIGCRRRKTKSESATSVDSGYEAPLQNSPVETILEEDENKCSSSDESDEDSDDDFVIIEMEDYEKLIAKKEPERSNLPVSNSAEDTARNLYRAFRQQWTQVDGEVLPPARPSIEPLARKNAIPEELESSVSLVEEFKRFRMMDFEEWSPPRFQIITTLHPYMTRDKIMASQNYLCVGCGTKVESRYSSRLRYCDYLGKYFCDCCHHYSESSIPGRILLKWNFSKYYVSNFSKNILDKIWDSHTFNIESENPDLYKKVKDLNRVKEVQQQLIHIRTLVTTCRFADGIIKAFEDVPDHLTQELHLFTCDDLYKVKQKTLLPCLRELLVQAVDHVEQCELCIAKGFICEFCQISSVIFPFQTDLCRRCEACKACYHKECFKTDCPKCLRIKAREALYNDLEFTSSCEEDSSSTSQVQE
ncbi:hypothetical protein GDO81_005218 [Engystomops pustulosus]|uniref:Rubicon Homology domain-containing protein n=2 Tax=Engystomops pustulosus TaxID=76066 RepID=A0AAV7CLT6_ENGPU|nr:hypothetical protein GDO81_005218 [Engystomops pustulosus]